MSYAEEEAALKRQQREAKAELKALEDETVDTTMVSISCFRELSTLDSATLEKRLENIKKTLKVVVKSTDCTKIIQLIEVLDKLTPLVQKMEMIAPQLQGLRGTPPTRGVQSEHSLQPRPQQPLQRRDLGSSTKQHSPAEQQGDWRPRGQPDRAKPPRAPQQLAPPGSGKASAVWQLQQSGNNRATDANTPLSEMRVSPGVSAGETSRVTATHPTSRDASTTPMTSDTTFTVFFDGNRGVVELSVMPRVGPPQTSAAALQAAAARLGHVSRRQPVRVMLPTVCTVGFEDKVSDWSAMVATQPHGYSLKLKLVACPKDLNVKVDLARPSTYVLMKVFDWKSQYPSEYVQVSESVEFSRRLICTICTAKSSGQGMELDMDTEKLRASVQRAKADMDGQVVEAQARIGNSKVLVKALSGKDVTLEVNTAETVAVVKAMYAAIANVPSDMQILIFKNRELKDSRTLADYGIVVANESTIHLVRKDFERPPSVEATGRMHDNVALTLWGDKDVDVVVYMPDGDSVDMSLSPGSSISDVVLLAGAKLVLQAAERQVLDITRRLAGTDKHPETMCDAPGCLSTEHLVCCSCHEALYCSRKCQNEAWSYHKQACKAARAAARSKLKTRR
eukprot:CAMPEP_0181374496 /NCGR_PEP_ID=MMETSP1106-20121128/16060_1 /TAXON_ID=81844 /ORGANISM="Mantoniella antarctica, Strain SL-175" /LENGTH=620 /DNA_ID=CAMNT_0023492499 /DNA_START=348 /DNA_END=2210 /DNA_ORIENTATION=+